MTPLLFPSTPTTLLPPPPCWSTNTATPSKVDDRKRWPPTLLNISLGGSKAGFDSNNRGIRGKKRRKREKIRDICVGQLQSTFTLWGTTFYFSYPACRWILEEHRWSTIALQSFFSSFYPIRWGSLSLATLFFLPASLSSFLRRLHRRDNRSINLFLFLLYSKASTSSSLALLITGEALPIGSAAGIHALFTVTFVEHQTNGCRVSIELPWGSPPPPKFLLQQEDGHMWVLKITHAVWGLCQGINDFGKLTGTTEDKNKQQSWRACKSGSG